MGTESQVITLDSQCGTVDGTFTLTHTDSELGYKRSTSSISVQPRLSSTVSVSTPPAIDATYCTTDATTYASGSTCYSYIKFTPHLPLWELSAGDFIRVGSQYRKIGACTVDTTSGNYSSCYTTNSFDSQYGDGTYAFSANTAGNIANELKNLPNDLFSGTASVSKVASGTRRSADNSAYSAGSVTIALGASELCVGDRTKMTKSTSDDHRAQVNSLTFASAGTISAVGTGSSAGELTVSASDVQMYRDSGARYEVDTKLAGNPSELACNTAGLRSVYHTDKAGYVMRSKPSRVFFVDPRFGSAQPAYAPIDGKSLQVGHPLALAARDVIYVGDQKCTVSGVDTADTVTATALQASTSTGSTANVFSANSNIHFVDCIEVLEATSTSTADEIETHAHIAISVGSTVSCAATDLKPLEWDVYPFENTREQPSDTVLYGKCTEGNAHNCVTVSDKGSNTCSDEHGDYSGCRVVKSGWTEFTVSKAFTAGHTGRMWVNKQGTKSLSECSGRGLCAGDSGDCECFKGYHDSSCSS